MTQLTKLQKLLPDHFKILAFKFKQYIAINLVFRFFFSSITVQVLESAASPYSSPRRRICQEYL